MRNSIIEASDSSIAKFMEVPLLTNYPIYHYLDTQTGLRLWLEVFELKYSTSWDWLMPVVEKCFDTDINTDSNNLIGDITHALVDVDIDEVYKACVVFIKWYNEQQNEDTTELKHVQRHENWHKNEEQG